MRDFNENTVPRSSSGILEEALAFQPRAAFVGFSGGDDSLATTHYCMSVIPNCRPLHINTGIGIEETRVFVRETCRAYGWDLLEIRAKEDCGQDYDELVLKFGFPGPAWHRVMYARLKDRCVEHLVRTQKKKWHDKILIATGVRKDESKRRMRYTGREINIRGAQLWCNPLYHYTKSDFMRYIRDNQIKRNPIAETLGMSGECLCGAFAHPGEKALIKVVSPATYQRIVDLEKRAFDAGFTWGWEDRPPRKRKMIAGAADPHQMILCVGCEK